LIDNNLRFAERPFLKRRSMLFGKRLIPTATAGAFLFKDPARA